MAQTQKMYLGGVPVIKNYFGENPIVIGNEPTFPYTIEYLVYAGGGNGGTINVGVRGAGGGGAGGLLSGSATIIPTTIYQVQAGTANQNSYFTGSLIYQYAIAGGIGGDSPDGNGAAGGSGGGGGGTAGLGAAGVINQGNSGSNASGLTTGAGGGGAGGAASGRNGGTGKTSSISGTSLTYCQGGSGGSNNGSATFRGFGGNGGANDGVPSAGTGGGGEVIIRYLGPQKGSGGTVTTDGAYIIHTFTSGSTSTYIG
jgi:hypothetical protein